MSFKPKSSSLKESPLWDKLLFPYQFEMNVDMPLQECIGRLMSLTQPKEGFWYPSNREVWTEKVSDNAVDFEIHLNRYGRGMSWTSGKCAGVVFRDSWSGKTVIKGQFTVGKLVLIILGFPILLFFVSLPRFEFGWTAVLITYGLVYGLQVWADRRKLRLVVYEALQQGEAQISN